MKGRDTEWKQWSLIFLMYHTSLEKWSFPVCKAKQFWQSCLDNHMQESLFCTTHAPCRVQNRLLLLLPLVSSQHPMLWLANTFCYIDLTEGETTAPCGWSDSFSLVKVGCVKPGLGVGSSILNATLCVKPHGVPINHLAHLNHMDNSFFNTLVICHLSCHFH